MNELTWQATLILLCCLFTVIAFAMQQLITNEHVQEMVRNTILEEEGSVQSKLKEAIFEPKMTRSKLRQVMGTGQMPVSVMHCIRKKGLLFIFYDRVIYWLVCYDCL